MREMYPHSSIWEEYLIYSVTKEFKDKANKFPNFKKNFSKSKEKFPRLFDEKSKNSLQLFDEFGLTRIQNLKEDRNLCAHPANGDNRDLRVFNQEDARLHIRNMFELVFLKESFYISDFINVLDSEILKYSTKYNTDLVECAQNNNIENYFVNNYLKDSTEEQKRNIIKFLIKNVIKEDEDKKEKLIFKLLDIFIDKNIELSKSIFAEKNFIEKVFNNISYAIKEYDDPTRADTSFSRVVMIFFKYPQLFLQLEGRLREKIKIECGINYNYYVLAYFLEDNLNTHLNKSKNIFEKNKKETNNFNDDYYCINVVLKLYHKFKEKDEFIEFLFDKVLCSYSYYQSEEILKNLLPVIINDFNKEQCLRLLKIFNNNNQYYGLGGVDPYGNEHKDLNYYLSPLKEIILSKLGSNFDKSEFSNLRIFN